MDEDVLKEHLENGTLTITFTFYGILKGRPTYHINDSGKPVEFVNKSKYKVIIRFRQII